MIRVTGVRFRTAGKVYYFDPADLVIKKGDNVIVETARGIEFGKVVIGIKEVEDEKVVQPLKSVIRLATDEDKKHEEENQAKEKEAMAICLEKIKKLTGLDLREFDDAIVFKVALMVKKYLSANPVKY